MLATKPRRATTPRPHHAALALAALMVAGSGAAAVGAPAPAAASVAFDEALGTLVATVRVPTMGGGSSAPEESGTCGDVSPLANECTFSVTLGPDGFDVIAGGIPGYSGTVVNEGRSSTGSYSLSCPYLVAPIVGNCTLSTSGRFLVGDTLHVTGRSLPTREGTPPLGYWLVAIES